MLDELPLNQRRCPWCENKNIQPYEIEEQVVWKCHKCSKKWKFIIGVVSIVEM